MKNFIIFIIVVLVLVGGYMFFSRDKGVEDTLTPPVADNTSTDVSSATSTASVKEFTMTSWMETKDGKMSAHFSLPEMRVKKGDTVRVTITNTAGTHDFVLDEFGVKKDTPLNEPVVVEFVADKVGTFEYYCSKYNHRQLGQKGNLIVE
ncbi:MAG: plastocyanin [Patescibacteria group bacterium]|jgi:heme/copper-type cytochrome/quinol oxidase subunit 2|nr:plastocyanin [Patescibacteria group bacterium]